MLTDMIRRYDGPVVIKDGKPCREPGGDREKTLSYSILRAHQKKDGKGGKMQISFDAMISHDITYVGIIQTARASGMTEFPIPYALTNCHNSLCAVGGTINEDDHAFGLSAAKKYGGIYVPANQAVIHQFAREKLAGCGKMVLGSDSHTRYGCYGTLGVGEGGGELAKQLLKGTWDIDEPQVILVWLEGTLPHGIGPHDVAIALVGATFPDGFVKNKILEFAGPGVGQLRMDFRTGIDVMTTETSCLSSIWITDDKTKAFYDAVGRSEAFAPLSLRENAGYDGMLTVSLDRMESMIALPFHPSKAYTIHELQENPREILESVGKECNQSLRNVSLDLLNCIGDDGKVRCEQGVIVGCAGGLYDNIVEAAAILNGKSVGNGFFDLSVYPSSAPINLALLADGTARSLAESGAVWKPCFCGPCFGAGDTPAHNTLSVRHATRNFANREGSKPSDGQIAAVALMDARSIAATAANGGVLTAATDVEYEVPEKTYVYSDEVYKKRCYYGFGQPNSEEELRFGPNITDWPKMPRLEDGMLLKLCAVIDDEVTTTDELIPSGETSSYRSNPVRLSEFALSRRVPEYVSRSKAVRALEVQREDGAFPEEAKEALALLGESEAHVGIASVLFAKKPGDGSAREQAASCQRVLGGGANLCYEYATKRYRSNCINWGILPFTLDKGTPFPYEAGDWVFVKDVKKNIENGVTAFEAKVLSGGKVFPLTLRLEGLSEEEKKILIEGSLINYYAAGYGR